jgi:hypothetical protein
MSVSVPLITEPRNQLLAALPFVHARARKQCHNAIRRAFDDMTGDQKGVPVMLHLATLNGPTLMEMTASVVRDEAELLVILMGREVDSNLAGLLRNCSNDASATESAVVASSESDHDTNTSGYGGEEECFRCVSEDDGSIKGDDADGDANGIILDIRGRARASDEGSAAERNGSESNVSAITLPSLLPMLGWVDIRRKSTVSI